MVTKKKQAARPAPSPEDRRRVAVSMVEGTACGIATARYLSAGEGGPDGHDVRLHVADVARRLADGDLSTLELMLLQQATTLQAMFASLAFNAQAQTGRENLQVVTSLALKAAAGSRQAITALAELRMPKQVLFAKQANVNNGGQQQVNNGPATGSNADAGPARASAEETESRQSELSGGANGLLENTGASGASGRTLSTQSPVGEVHRPANG